MAMVKCRSCQGTYMTPQPDGSSYFHACAPTHNPAYDAQFTMDAEGNRIPRRPLNPAIPEMVDRPDGRNENVERKPDGKVGPKFPGKGTDTI